MKRRFSFAVWLIAAIDCLFIGCVEKKEKPLFPEDSQVSFLKNLTHQDTLDFLKPSNACMDTLKLGKIDKALSIIYFDRNDTLLPLTGKMKEKLRQRFERFPIKEYRLESFDIQGFSSNSVVYTIRFREESKQPNTIKLVFNPVWINDTWYLTLKND